MNKRMREQMRFIDADELQKHFRDMQNYEKCAANFQDERGEPSTNWYCVEDALENAPTVEVIPVEWMRGFDLYYSGISGGSPYLREMLEAWKWEKEQAKEKQEGKD